MEKLNFENNGVDFGSVGVGKKAVLRPLKVTVINFKVEMQKGKDGKEFGDKLDVLVEHADAKDGQLSISKVKFMKNEKLKSAGLWFKLDEDGCIPHGSALAALLRHVGVDNVKALVGKQLDTCVDDEGYLIFKAY